MQGGVVCLLLKAFLVYCERVKCMYVFPLPLSVPFWGGSWPWQAVCRVVLPSCPLHHISSAWPWSGLWNAGTVQLNFCSFFLRYARGSRVNKAVLVFFLLLSLKNVFLQCRVYVSASEPHSWEAVCFGSWGIGWLWLLAPGEGLGNCGLSTS